MLLRWLGDRIKYAALALHRLHVPTLPRWTSLFWMVDIYASGAGAPFAAVTAPAATLRDIFGNRVPTRIVVAFSGGDTSVPAQLLPHSEKGYSSIERSAGILDSWQGTTFDHPCG